MKRIRFISCMIALLLSILSLEIALGQETTSVVNTPKASGDYRTGEVTTDGGYVVNLEVDDGFLTLTIPADFQYQPDELTGFKPYPYSYVFTDENAGISFIVYSSLHSSKDQKIFLKKLYDKSNKFIVYDDVLIGEHTYIVYTKEQATNDCGFLICTESGYSYQFQCILPHDSIQNEIPAEAISILSTLEIHENSAMPD